MGEIMSLFGGSKKDDGTAVNNIIPTARDVVRAIAEDAAEDVKIKDDVATLKTKAMINDAIKADNTQEEIAKLRGELAMANKKIEELQAKSPSTRG